MKKTLQECKNIVAQNQYGMSFNLSINNLRYDKIIELTDLANKMYYEQSEWVSLKAENERLKEEITIRVCMIKSEPNGIVRETMINNLLINL